MAFSVKDVPKFKRNLDPTQAEEWCRIANNTIQDCLQAGDDLLEAEIVAIRKANAMFGEKEFSEDNIRKFHQDEKIVLAFAEVNPDDESEYQLILPIGLTYSDWYGEIIITRTFCERMVKNQSALKNTKPFLDTDHDRRASNGWLIDMRVSENGLEVKWEFTERGQKLIDSKEYKYYSATFGPLIDRDSGEVVFPVLLGCALTNSPVMKQLPEAHLSEETNSAHSDGENIKRGEKLMTLAEIIAAILALSETDRTQVLKAMGFKDQQGDVTTLSETVTEMKNRVVALSDENKRLKKELQEKEVTDILETALSEGKIKPAEKDDWEKKLGENFDVYSKVLEHLPENSAVDLEEHGSDNDGDASGTVKLSDEARQGLLEQGWTEEQIAEFAEGGAA